MTTETIPIISLWQPWASLWVAGAKRIETRSWPCTRRLRLPCVLAVHAAKKQTAELYGLFWQSPFWEACAAICGFDARKPRVLPMGMVLPFGAAVGLVRLKECLPTSFMGQPQAWLRNLSEQERAF